MLRVATLSEDTEAEGPGRRWALWVQGCSIRCPGCCNPEMFSATAGTAWTVEDVIARLRAAAARGIEGISLLGGEPFEQAPALAAVARVAKQLALTVMIYSGYTIDELRARPDAAELLALTDLLVDGRYDRERPEPPPPVGRRWIGSTNQTMHFLTDAYRADDPRMRTANTVELHWSKGQLLVNGWPAGADVLAALKRRLPKTS